MKSSSLNCNRNIRKKRKELFLKLKESGMDSIPIFIISFNRLSYVSQAIEWLEKNGYKNIHIIDNASTYPPLLRYYSELPYQIHYLEKNLGYMAFWKSRLFDEYRNYFYVVSDPDLIPVAECPKDFLWHFASILKRFSNLNKVGFSLKIDDIPEDNKMKESIIKWESEFCKRKFFFQNVYYAGIDTTFALYMPDSINTSDSFYRGLRTGFPYQVKHLPWYKSEADITEEDLYYSETKENGWWDVTKDSVSEEGSNTEAWKEINRK